MSVNRDRTPIISKRDGTSEPFSASKLRRCVDVLLRGVGFDPHLATPLSKAVALHIQRCDDDAPLTSSYVFDCVHAVLSQTGLSEAAVQAGLRRVRPCLMTTATTILALLPVLTSRGRGSDVMVPMAIPSFGGMLIELMTLFVVPVSYCWMQELAHRMKRNVPDQTPQEASATS